METCVRVASLAWSPGRRCCGRFSLFGRVCRRTPLEGLESSVAPAEVAAQNGQLAVQEVPRLGPARRPYPQLFRRARPRVLAVLEEVVARNNQPIIEGVPEKEPVYHFAPSSFDESGLGYRSRWQCWRRWRPVKASLLLSQSPWEDLSVVLAPRLGLLNDRKG